MSQMEETKQAQEDVNRRYSKVDRSRSNEKGAGQLIVEEDGEGAENGAQPDKNVNNFYETQDIRKPSASHSRSPSKGSYQA